jgi:hypothetical protein
MTQQLMEEYGFEIDDVRWYLSSVFAERLLSYKDDHIDLARFIWSGSLEKELYNMEESYLADLEDQFQRGLLDDVQLRAEFAEIEAARKKRRG